MADERRDGKVQQTLILIETGRENQDLTAIGATEALRKAYSEGGSEHGITIRAVRVEGEVKPESVLKVTAIGAPIKA